MSPLHYLTRTELRELVGREQRAPIIAWLRKKRWRFTLDADGWPKVGRAYHDRHLWLAGGPAPKTEAEPDFAAIAEFESRSRKRAQRGARKVSEGAFYLEWSPAAWPVQAPMTLHVQREDRWEIRLQCEPDGYFAARMTHDGKSREHRFQRVTMRAGEFAKMACSWKDNDDLSLFVGGQKLGPYVADEPPIELRSFEVHVDSARVTQIGSAALALATPEEWLFVTTLADLSERIARGTAYDWIRASGLLRQLLFDAATPLVHAANRRAKISLEYEVARPRAIADGIPAADTEWRTLHPTASGELVDRVDLERFLGRTTIIAGGVACSVRQVVAAIAHVFGGIHLGRPEDEQEIALVALRDRVLVHDQSLVFRALQDISRVTLDGVTPLVAWIAALKP